MKKHVFLLSSLLITTISIHAQSPTFTTLGIGITPPEGTLHIHSTEGHYYDEPSTLDNRDELYPYDYYQTLFRLTNTTTGTLATNGFVIDQTNKTITFKQYENAPVYLKGYQNKGVSLLPNGRVGIGTDQPESELDVAGSVRVTKYILTGGHVSFCNNSQPLTIGMAHTEELDWGSTYVGFNAKRNDNGWVRKNDGYNNGGAVIWATIKGDLLFANLSSTGGNTVEGITDEEIMSAVNLKLGRDGVLTAKEIKVTLDEWPDYVFGEGYRLASLPETEAYIKCNGHLPGIPSAAVVEEEGLSLGEMNRMLMQKVEELTLHLIELQKQIDELKNQQK